MNCIVCDKLYGEEGFYCFGGDPAYGPAYWSDKGILCSPKCSLEHFMERMKNGDKLVPSKRPEPPTQTGDPRK